MARTDQPKVDQPSHGRKAGEPFSAFDPLTFRTFLNSVRCAAFSRRPIAEGEVPV
jgi:hypothetical protein